VQRGPCQHLKSRQKKSNSFNALRRWTCFGSPKFVFWITEIRVLNHRNSCFESPTRPPALASRGLRGCSKGLKGLKGLKEKKGGGEPPPFFWGAERRGLRPSVPHLMHATACAAHRASRVRSGQPVMPTKGRPSAAFEGKGPRCAESEASPDGFFTIFREVNTCIRR
jgi:hypothetical protein